MNRRLQESLGARDRFCCFDPKPFALPNHNRSHSLHSKFPYYFLYLHPPAAVKGDQMANRPSSCNIPYAMESDISTASKGVCFAKTAILSQLQREPRRVIQTAPERVGNQHGASTKPREVATSVVNRSTRMWPGNRQSTVHEGGLRGHASQAERVAPDVRGWRRPHPPPWLPHVVSRIRQNRI